MKSLWRGWPWWSLRARLLLLASVAALPLTCLTVFETWQTLSRERARADELLGRQIDQVSGQVQQMVAKADRLLHYMENRPEVIEHRIEACRGILTRLVSIDPDYANAGIVDGTGTPLCASWAEGPGAAPPSVAHRAWFSRAMAADGTLAVGDPVMGAVVGRPTLSIARKVRSPSGHEGVLFVSLDLEAISEQWRTMGLPPGSVVSVIDGRGRILSRHPEPQRWIGQDASGFVRDFFAAHPTGRGEAPGTDGTVRRSQIATVAPFDWRVVVGVPSSALMAPARQQLQAGVARLLVVVGIAMVAALLMARRLIEPIDRLRTTASRLADGESRLRISENLPPELRPVAQEFNRMLDAQRASNERLQRIGTMFEVLTLSNRAITHDGPFALIGDAVCRACTENAGARTAALLMLDAPSGRLVRMASSGPLGALARDHERWRADVAPDGPSIWHEAMTGLSPVVVHDCLADPRSQAFRAVAEAEGVHALGLFPVVRNGRTVGLLLLHFTQRDWFDHHLVALLRSLTSDLAFALQRAEQETARADAERRAADEADRFRRLFDIAPVTLSLRDLDTGVVLAANARFLNILGVERDAVVGRRLADLGLGLSADDEAQLRQALRTHGEAVRDLEVPVRHPGGRMGYALLSAALVDVDGRPAMLVAGQDVTAVREAAQRLRERDDRLAGIIESAMDAIITVGQDHRIRVFNAAAARMFGLPAEDAIGQPLSHFVPLEAREAHEQHLRHFADSEQTVVARRMKPRGDLVALRADGSSFPIEASVSRLVTGNDVLMTAVVRDLTDAHAARRAREAQVAAEAANRAKTDFIANIGHELRTPLNALLGFVQLVASDTQSPVTPRQQQHLALATEGGRHLMTLIEDLLDVARIESGRLEVHALPLHLQPVLESAVSLTLRVAQAREVSLRWQPQATAALWVLADPVRVRQVVINLLSNAIKYNRPGGHVTLHAQAEGDRVVIDVRDSGVGMSPLQQERLFRRFDRLGRDDGDVQGLGIGLALTRELVQAMQGEMLVDSVEGAGTSVRVALPAALAPAAIPAPSATRRADEAPRGDAVLRGRVLYIEDEPVNRLLLQSWAERHPDLRIDCADTGLAGLCEAEASAPDLVLMDLGLPDIEGLQLLRRLIELPALQRVPVVVLSANALPADVEAALAAGARAYWTKPIDFDRFTTQLATLLPLTADATG